MNTNTHPAAVLRRKAALAVGLFALSMAVPTFAADTVIATVPFAFQAGKKSLPAGEYEFVIRPDDQVLAVTSTANPKGETAMVGIVTTLASQDSAEARVVFDKVGGQYLLSEVWQPEGEGVLIETTRGRHGHHVLRARPKK